MFERFTERARQVVVLAQDEALRLRHDYIGTEHLLLGLLREEEGLAAQVLSSFDVTPDEVRVQVARIVGQGDEAATGHIPFTPRAKKVLELSLRESLVLGHNYIGTEHLLLGLVQENEGVASRILLDFEVDAETIRDEVMSVLSGSGSHRGENGVESYVPSSPPVSPEVIDEIGELDDAVAKAMAENDVEQAARSRRRRVRLAAAARALERAWSEQAETQPSGRVGGFAASPAPVEPPWTSRESLRLLPRGVPYYRSGFDPSLVVGWVLFAVALAIGLALGWLLWA